MDTRVQRPLPGLHVRSVETALSSLEKLATMEARLTETDAALLVNLKQDGLFLDIHLLFIDAETGLGKATKSAILAFLETTRLVLFSAKSILTITVFATTMLLVTCAETGLLNFLKCAMTEMPQTEMDVRNRVPSSINIPVFLGLLRVAAEDVATVRCLLAQKSVTTAHRMHRMETAARQPARLS
jgi:hypothetical protein